MIGWVGTLERSARDRVKNEFPDVPEGRGLWASQVQRLHNTPISKFVTQKDSVARAALFQATAHALHLDGEPAIAQALLEFSIISGRPDGQHPVHLESRASGGYSPVVIEPGVVRGR